MENNDFWLGMICVWLMLMNMDRCQEADRHHNDLQDIRHELNMLRYDYESK